MSKQHIRAIILFSYVMLSSAVLAVIMRYLADNLHAFQKVFFYFLGTACGFTPWLIRGGIIEIVKGWRPLYFLRSIAEFLAFSLYFLALQLIPLPLYSALTFMAPIFGIMLAVVILGEKANIHTVIALIGGLIGVLFITRPGITEFNIGIILTLAGAMIISSCGVMIKTLLKKEPVKHVVVNVGIITPMICLPFAIYHWQPLSVDLIPWILAIFFISYTQQIAVTKALMGAPYSMLIPLNFLQLVLISVLAYFYFGETINAPTAIGATIIIFSTIYHIKHHSKLVKCDGEQ